MLLTAVLSIHNRSKLLARALPGYLWQTIGPDNWEIVLVDDMSTEDLSKVYRPYLGEMNFRHVRMDHTRHALWRERNPSPGAQPFENWFHTPALSINLGISLAHGGIICLCHPEMLHKNTNFENAYRMIESKKRYLFGTAYLASTSFNQALDRMGNWTKQGWPEMLRQAVGHKTVRYTTELYWYVSFLPRRAAETVGGVDFEYLNGVAGEDDDFRERVEAAGFPAVHVSEIEGIHQDHSDEREPHRLRGTKRWQVALERNRAIYKDRRANGFWPVPANSRWNWTASETLVSVTEWRLGCKEPLVHAPAEDVTIP